MRATARFLLLVLCAASLAGGVRAESTPEAREWLEKMAAVHTRAPFSVTYTAAMSPQGGQGPAMKVDGRMTQGEGRRLHAEIAMEMTPPGAQAPARTTLLAVSDGAMMWMEVQSPMAGGGQKQVMKMDLAKMGELAGKNPMVAMMSRMDPVAQVGELAKMFDFQVAETAGGKVTLRAAMTEEARARLSQSLGVTGKTGFTDLVLVLDARTAFPVEARLGGDPPPVVMRFTDLEFLDPSSVDPKLFSYSPPEGVPVLDLAAMAEQAQGAPQGKE